MCEQYNGWSNRETWAAKLWLDNEFYLYVTVQDLINEAIASKEEDQDFACTACLADNLESLFDDISGDFAELTTHVFNMLKDIGSLYRVKWYEIANAYLEEAKLNA